jgi:hypothetical protein
MVISKLAHGVANSNIGSSAKNAHLPHSTTKCLPKNFSLKALFRVSLHVHGKKLKPAASRESIITLSMKTLEPTITDPTGAPNPFDRHTCSFDV